MGFAPLVKSCEKLFVKAPFTQTLPKDFAKTDFESVNQTFHLGRLKEDTRLSVEEYEKLFKQKMEALD